MNGGVRKIQNKTKVSITVLTLAIVSVLLISIFLVNSVSPLGKFIHVEFICSQSENPIVGLPITIGDTTINTDAAGKAIFGSGYASGTYTIDWTWWSGPASDTVTIDCTKKDWYYTYELVNPEVHKTFLVDTAYSDYPPIEGLEVTLKGEALTQGVQVGTTNAAGYVAFILEYPFHDYSLNWVWNGEHDSEPVLWNDFVDGVWTAENKLEPKSGGDKTTLG